MSVISEVKCGRCDRRYSGFRARCPYCGARRNKRGKRADEAENAKAKLVIGVVMLVVLIGATMILLFASWPETAPDISETPGATDNEPVVTTPDDVDVVINSTPPDDVTESPTPIEIVIQTVTITYNGEPKTDITLRVNETQPMGFVTSPETEGREAVWESTDEDIFMVVDGKATGISPGHATLKCTIDGVTGECIVRVKSAS